MIYIPVRFRQIGLITSCIAFLFLSCSPIKNRLHREHPFPIVAAQDRVLADSDSTISDLVPAARDSIDRLMAVAIADSVFPGAVLLLTKNARIVYHQAFGNYGYGDFARPLEKDAIFDLASVTKVIATTSAAMVLVGDSLLSLDDKVSQYIPEFGFGKKKEITIRHLMTHSSGLPPYIRYFLEGLSAEKISERIFNEPLIYDPGTAYKYSDLGMITLGKIIEKISATTLDRYCFEKIFQPLQMKNTFFNPPPVLYAKIPPTENDDWRGRMIHGVVHDENAFALGGVAGHAGLFSNAADLAVFLQMLLNGGVYNSQSVLALPVIQQFVQKQKTVKKSTRALGWDTRSKKGSTSGDLMSMFAFGHTGFTGTSVWVDPANDLFIILLTNRVHPTRKNRRVVKFRPQLHNLIMSNLEKSD
ncbi:MAG: class A beta-lactamase-related serine hydrolase [Calditrichaeota bacterium]|nr:MAG: class A beta-lactamase-related serine hydrolase [Calditrichota bacterium]